MFIAIMLAINMIFVNITTYYQFIAQAVQRFGEYSIKSMVASGLKLIFTVILFLLYYFKHKGKLSGGFEADERHDGRSRGVRQSWKRRHGGRRQRRSRPGSFKWMDGSPVLTDPGKAGLLSLVEVALWLCYLTWTLRCNLFLLSYFKSRLIIYL